MILSDKQILEALEKGDLYIEPFRREALGSNSYDVHLGPYLRVYAAHALHTDRPLPSSVLKIPPNGLWLVPGVLYLGSTEEYTESRTYVPFLEGKSSVGRLGIQIHSTASKGDIGFCNHWTLEISVIHPVKIYAGMPIGQLIFFKLAGEVQIPYNERPSASYKERNPLPTPSFLWKNLQSHENTRT
ncbi:MAG: dCTP deaminase [Bacteroidia bacterium]|nr:dCTP deaminase [Bacteroidia bacterium]MCX7652576.1 dCTP deaminase [Bacteroidia bacterium]MDW8417166.1 dCTP deaminase [Bacteroidia bacterium]